MLEKKTSDLLNQEFDKANSEKESASVKRILERNSEARKYLSDLQEMSSLFGRVKNRPAPADLKNKILGAIPFPPTPRPVVTSPLGSFVQDLRTYLRYQYILTFGGGVVAGILLFVLVNGTPPDNSTMTGTMGHVTSAPVENRADVNLPQVSGTITGRKSKSTITADLSLKASSEVDVLLNFEPQHVRFDTFKPTSDAPVTMVSLEGQVRLSLSGQSASEVQFTAISEQASPIVVRLFSKGILLSEYQLTFVEQENHQ